MCMHVQYEISQPENSSSRSDQMFLKPHIISLRGQMWVFRERVV